jgi:hypothetical protein
MEQRLYATYLHPGLVERTIALGIGALGVGIGILLVAWGISFLWRYTPPEIAVHIANPELHVAQDLPLKVTQDKPFVVGASEPLKIDPLKLTVGSNSVGSDAKTATSDVIKREVTVFSTVKHGRGAVVTGWTYSDGSGGRPVQQYCYYAAPNLDRSSKRVDIGSNGGRLLDVDAGLVPDLEEAIGKCQWWQG